MIPKTQVQRRPKTARLAEWVELRAHGVLWGRYHPRTQVIEFARQDRRVVFDLARLRIEHQAIVGANDTNTDG